MKVHEIMLDGVSSIKIIINELENSDLNEIYQMRNVIKEDIHTDLTKKYVDLPDIHLRKKLLLSSNELYFSVNDKIQVNKRSLDDISLFLSHAKSYIRKKIRGMTLSEIRTENRDNLYFYDDSTNNNSIKYTDLMEWPVSFEDVGSDFKKTEGAYEDLLNSHLFIRHFDFLKNRLSDTQQALTSILKEVEKTTFFLNSIKTLNEEEISNASRM
jgi:hypothetical protein